MALLTAERLSEAIGDSDVPIAELGRIAVALQSRYQEPWRHYHVERHIDELLQLLADNSDRVIHAQRIGWAILYHDSVYDPQAPHGRNEELSAQLAERELASVLSANEVGMVAAYIRATAEHTPAGTDPDLDFFLDADLAILGAHPDHYDDYTHGIRAEYAFAPDDAYRAGRVSILRGLANRVDSGLFRTEFFRDRCETQAQVNIEREIASLV